MCLNPVNINGVQFPCGKCPECKIAEAYRYGMRGLFVGSRYSKCCNLTLTYRDEVVPWRKYALYLVSGHVVFHPIGDIVRYCDPSTGEVLHDCLRPELIVERDFFFNGQHYGVRLIPVDMPVSVSLDEFTSVSDDPMLDCEGDCPIRFRDTGFTYVFDFDDYSCVRKPWSEIFLDDHCAYLGSCYLQVLCQRDLQLLLKRFRERYMGFFGYRPEIPYVGVSEYGPRTCRPHYHFCAFYDELGDSDFVERHIVFEWERLFGHVEYKARSRSSDPAAFANFAKYVAKYGKKIDKAKHVLDLFRVLPLSHTFSSVGFRSVCNDVVRSLFLAGRSQSSFFDSVDSLHRILLDACNFTFVAPVSVPTPNGYSFTNKVQRVPYTFITDALNSHYYLKCSKLIDNESFVYYRKVVIRSTLSRVIAFVSRFGGVELLSSIARESPSFRSWSVAQYLAKIVEKAKSSSPTAFDGPSFFRAEADYLASFRSFF